MKIPLWCYIHSKIWGVNDQNTTLSFNACHSNTGLCVYNHFLVASCPVYNTVTVILAAVAAASSMAKFTQISNFRIYSGGIWHQKVNKINHFALGHLGLGWGELWRLWRSTPPKDRSLEVKRVWPDAPLWNNTPSWVWHHVWHHACEKLWFTGHDVMPMTYTWRTRYIHGFMISWIFL